MASPSATTSTASWRRRLTAGAHHHHPPRIDTNFFAPPPPDSLDKLRELIFGGMARQAAAGQRRRHRLRQGLAGPGAAVRAAARGQGAGAADGGRRSAVEAKLARVRELGMIDQVRFPGLLDDVRASLASRHAGFVCRTARRCPSPAARSWAWACRPWSATRRLPENVTDGVDGWIVPVRDVPAMTARLRLMLTSRKWSGRWAARETARLQPAPFAAATLDVYQRTLAGR